MVCQPGGNMDDWSVALYLKVTYYKQQTTMILGTLAKGNPKCVDGESESCVRYNDTEQKIPLPCQRGSITHREYAISLPQSCHVLYLWMLIPILYER